MAKALEETARELEKSQPKPTVPTPSSSTTNTNSAKLKGVPQALLDKVSVTPAIQRQPTRRQQNEIVSLRILLELEYHMSRLMGKPTICIGENKDADQLRGNHKADQRLCFRYSDSTIPLLLKSEISSF